MISLTAAVLTSLFNLAIAANVYLSLRGWLVPLEPSGMQLMVHPLITAPVVVVTSAWLFLLSRANRCSRLLWKVNALGLLVPIISLQTGVVHHGYDKLGLLVICLIAAALLLLYGNHVKQYARS